MNDTSNTLWYKIPAENWNESLPLGNGRIGANIFGGAKNEKLTINEDTLWSGYPRMSARINMNKVYKKIQALVLADKLSEAQALAEAEFGDFLVQMYLPFGEMELEMNHTGEVTEYKRELSLENAVHTVSYVCDGVGYQRTTFISHRDQILCMNLKASEHGAIGFRLDLKGKLQCEKHNSDNIIAIYGNCPVCKAPYGQSHDDEDKKVYSEAEPLKGVGYSGLVTLKTEGGSTATIKEGIVVKNADEVNIIFAIRTSFNAYNRHPVFKGKEYKERCLLEINDALEKSFETLLDRSIREHKKLYDRMDLKIGSENNVKPTDERLFSLFDGKEDPELFALLFNFGRYLAICASRKGTQPANLQGIWNDKTLPPWSSNYTLNINTQMNYWPMLGCNLAECMRPFIKMTKELCENGKKTAEQYYGVSGSVCHHATDIWRLTHPSTNLLGGSGGWGFWNMSSGWLASTLYEYYKYTGDKEYLENDALPVMKEFAQFYSEMLIEDENGEYILCPSTSPENSFLYQENKLSIAKTTAMTMAIIRELFSNYKSACEILGVENALYLAVCKQLQKLYGYHISKDGSICEWDSEYEEAEITHRHLSHLYGLFPGNEITPDKTPKLAEACRASLVKRGDEGTGWSLAWKISLWARLRDGEKALKLLKRQLRPVNSSDEGHDAGGGSYINLFCAHPPFQIDGNFGATSGIAEMLLQCNGDKVFLLPALPKEWASGSVKGMCIHGGATIDFSWQNGKVAEYEIHNGKIDYKVQ